MNLRARLILSVTAITAVTFTVAFGAVFFGVNRLEESHLDSALRAEAEAEARDGSPFAISDRPGPAVGRLGPLTKYGAVYGPDGSLLLATPTFGGEAPALPARAERLVGSGFNFWFRREYLRAVIVPQPDTNGAQLLLAVPRSYLDGDDEALVTAMSIVFVLAIVWAALVTAWVVIRLTRYHEAIAAVARRVASGDLAARIGQRTGDPQSAQLARDVDEMIGRLDDLVGSQKRFIAHAAHELRSPLTMLYGELAHALRRSRDADSYRKAIEEALAATERLKLLTEDLLALARLSVNREIAASPLQLAELLASVSKATEGAAAEKQVNIAVAATQLTFDGCASDLERMVRNLVENAVRHAPSGSTVHVVVHSSDDAIEVHVTDEGPGIPRGEEARIFEPFYRVASTRDESSGAGLGLAIAREIARGHGGDVAIVPTSEKGARFVVRLPVGLRLPDRGMPQAPLPNVSRADDRRDRQHSATSSPSRSP